MERRQFLGVGTAALGVAFGAHRAGARQTEGTTMRITLSGVFVEDQAKALEFYTNVIGFVKKEDIPVGQYRWLTVVSPQEPDGTELLLEPNENPAARTFQKSIFEQGIPATMFAVENIRAEFERLKSAGVTFTMEPTTMAGATIATFDDTCGNLIRIYQA